MLRDVSAVREISSGQRPLRQAVAERADVSRAGEPDILARRRDLGERAAQKPQAMGLAEDIGVQRHAHHQRPRAGTITGLRPPPLRARQPAL